MESDCSLDSKSRSDFDFNLNLGLVSTAEYGNDDDLEEEAERRQGPRSRNSQRVSARPIVLSFHSVFLPFP